MPRESDEPTKEPRLELPSLRFGGKKRGKASRNRPEEAPARTAQPALPETESETLVDSSEYAGAAPEVRALRLAAMKPLHATVLTGAVAGLTAVLLAIGASRGCEALRDTSNCGGGLGLLALLAIVAVEVTIGANLLKAWQISDPLSTSLLGVVAVATIVMLALLSHLDSPWMLLVIPLLTAAAFALSWWVMVRFAETGDEDSAA